ncbi:hypothetical protein BGZ96_011283, partial [Linnemannia gamsii]
MRLFTIATIALTVLPLVLAQPALENDATTKVRTDVKDTPSDSVHAYPLTAREQNMCDDLISLLTDTIEEAQSIIYAILEKASSLLAPVISYNQRHDLLWIRSIAGQFGQEYVLADSYKFTKRSVNLWLARYADRQDTNLRVYADLLGISSSNVFIEAR